MVSGLKHMRYLDTKRRPSCSTNSKKSKCAPHICRFLNIWTLTENSLCSGMAMEGPISPWASARSTWWASLGLHRPLHRPLHRGELKVAGRGGEEPQGRCDCQGQQMEFSSLRAEQRVPRDSNQQMIRNSRT